MPSRPFDSSSATPLEGAGELPTFSAESDPFADIEARDLELLPHFRSEQEMARHFPILVAPSAAVNVEDWLAGDEDMGKIAGRRRNGLEPPVPDRWVQRPLGSS